MTVLAYRHERYRRCLAVHRMTRPQPAPLLTPHSLTCTFPSAALDKSYPAKHTGSVRQLAHPCVHA